MAWLLFDRPEKLNAMTIDAWREMGEALTALGKEPEVRVLILAGEGRAFLAGHDVGEMREHSRAFAAGTFKPADLHEAQKMLQETTRLIRKLRFPVIAAVHGYAVGAGCEVTVACDLVVAAEGTKFGFPEVNVGVTITNGGTFLLPRKIGLARARGRPDLRHATQVAQPRQSSLQAAPALPRGRIMDEHDPRIARHLTRLGRCGLG